MSRKMSIYKTPSLIEFGIRSKRHTLPETHQSDLSRSRDKLFYKFGSSKRTELTVSRSEHCNMALRADQSGGYLMEMLEGFLDREKRDYHGISLVTSVLMDIGCTSGVLQLFKREAVFDNMNCLFGRHYDEFTKDFSDATECFATPELMELNLCLALYHHLLTFSIQSAIQLLTTDQSCFYTLFTLLYEQIVLWVERTSQQQLSLQLLLPLKITALLVFSAVDYVTDKFVELHLNIGKLGDCQFETIAENSQPTKTTDLDADEISQTTQE